MLKRQKCIDKLIDRRDECGLGLQGQCFPCPLVAGKRCSELLPNAPFYVVEKAGHAPYFERPDDVGAALSNFFSAPGSAAAGEQRI